MGLTKEEYLQKQTVGTRVTLDFPDLHWIPGNPWPDTQDNVIAHFCGCVVMRDGKYHLCSNLGFDETGDNQAAKDARRLNPILNYLNGRLKEEIDLLNGGQ